MMIPDICLSGSLILKTLLNYISLISNIKCTKNSHLVQGARVQGGDQIALPKELPKNLMVHRGQDQRLQTVVVPKTHQEDLQSRLVEAMPLQEEMK